MKALEIAGQELPAGARREPVRHLYVHVPFCASKCGYCAFYSEPSRGELIERYVAAVIRELELVAPDLEPDTVFFGGGTPTVLNLRQWERVLGAFDRLGLDRPGEWTVEANPATLSLDKARLLRERGVTRVSLGVQSLDEALLDRLGRVHNREMVFRSYDLLRRAGFANVNLDLMFAIPGQTLEVWRRTVAEALALQSEHLSTYEVIYEEDTPLYAQLAAGQCDIDEDLACDMYEAWVDAAGAAGFQQYEVANFARPEGSERAGPAAFGGARVTGPRDAVAAGVVEPGIPAFACRHNIAYWRGRPFHGIGPSASGFVGGVRTRNRANTTLYCAELESGRRAIDARDELTPLGRAGEIAGVGLRLVVGWPWESFRRGTGFDLRQEWAGDLRWLVEQGWGELDGDGFRLTRRGLRFADLAAERFLRS